MFSWLKRKSPVTITRAELKRKLFLAFNGYTAYLLDRSYDLVPDRNWILKNCPQSKVWSSDWDCNKIAIYAMAFLQTHCVGAIVVEWKQRSIHALLVVAFEDGTVQLFDPHSREFFNCDGRKVYKLWV